MAKPKDIRTFAREQGIEVWKCIPAKSNQLMENSKGMNHWDVTLRNGAGSIHKVTFSMGSGHNGRKPEVYDILTSLASDCATAENCQSLEDFCSELGYDPDSRKAERIWNAVEAQAANVKAFMGDAYEEFVWSPEDCG